MNRQSDYDELSALIDSMENDDTIEKKIDDFKKKHKKKIYKRSARTNRQMNTMHIEQKAADSQPIQPMRHGLKPKGDMEKTRVIKPAVESGQENGAAKTAVFNPDTIDDALTGSNETVVLDDNQIHTMIEKDETQRQNAVFEQAETREKKERLHLSRNQIVAVILSVACILIVVLGVVNYINANGNMQINQTEENNADYQSLLSWAKKYESLSKSRKQDITEYEEIYNNCTSEQQKEIDRILKDATGKNFNQLLAKAKSSKKKASKNNNVKSAEKKAKLKKQISSLESQLTDAQTSLTSVQSAISTLNDQIDSTNQKITEKNNALTNAQTDLEKAEEQLKDAQSKNSNSNDSDDENGSNSSEIKSAQEAVDKAQTAYDKAAKENDTSSLQDELTNYQNQLNDYQNQQAQLQSQINSLNAQIAELNNRLADLN